jgi:hypothetical protein
VSIIHLVLSILPDYACAFKLVGLRRSFVRQLPIIYSNFPNSGLSKKKLLDSPEEKRYNRVDPSRMATIAAGTAAESK